jgi:hypothetical protein
MDAAMLAALTPKKVTESTDGFHSILYGDPKVGKTTTLDDPNMKVLLLDMEGGESVLKGAPNVDVVKIKNMEHLNAYAELLNKKQWINHEGKLAPVTHGLIALDSITRLQDLVKDYVVRVIAPNRKREVKGVFGAQSDWGNFGTIISDLVKYFHLMTKRGEESLNVMWTAHRDNKYENPNAETQITGTQIKMQGSSVPIVMSVVDAIFYMNKVEKVNAETKKAQVHYFIQTDKMGIVEAGVRQSKRDERLPKVIENPVWSEIFTKLGYNIGTTEN